ncbi:MAG: tetratricopeptide repeat protein, partial [Rhodanobacter sp.]
MTNERDQRAAAYREKARAGLGQGDPVQAEQAYLQVLNAYPYDLEALQKLANIELARGAVDRAIELLTNAHRAHPNDAVTLHQLGVARMSSGDLRAAVADLGRGLALAPNMFVARLRMGMLLDQLGEAHQALVASFMAINAAQARGRWLSDETTAPEYRDAVKQAMQYVDTGRHRLFDGVLEPLRQRYGKSELMRVEQCLAIYLGEQVAAMPDPRQQPKFLYFPGVPSQPYYPRERFPWLAELEAGTEAIREELRAVLSQPRDLESF